MLDLESVTDYEFLRPLVTGWLAKIEAAISCPDRKRWKEIADECVMFYGRSAAAMWDQSYSKKFWRGVKAPKFRITINKAFELVAVYGPNLLWDVPHRTVEPKRAVEIPQELFQGNPESEMLYQQLMQTSQHESSRDKLVAHLMQTWLNYTPREMPGSGMESHNELAVIDALVKGRGCLWPQIYTPPGSDRTLTGCFRTPPDDLLIDPDFKTLAEAKWIARRHVDPHWVVERRFKLPPGSLKNKATLESGWHYAELKGSSDGGLGQRRSGKTNDLVVWYEIWSKMGTGSRMTGMAEFLKNHLDEVTGDYAYLCICPDCHYPLNCPSDVIRNGAPDSEISQRFDWPVPLWMDDKWPVEVLDFYVDTESAWPIAPLAPAMGELKAMNAIVSWLVSRTHAAGKQMWAVLGQYHDEMKKQLEDGDDLSVFAIPPGNHDDIRKICQILEGKEVNKDAWAVLDLLAQAFDKRTGLTEFAYGRNEGGTQDRTAETTQARARAIGVRPEHMQKKVKGWQARAASTEAAITWLFVKAKDVVPKLGQAGAMLWQQHIENADGELVMRQMSYDISAASIRRPDRDRDIENLQEVMSRWLPVLQTYGESSGDYEPVNGVMEKWGELHDMDLSRCLIQPQEPDPELPMLQKEQLKAEVQKTSAEAQKAMAEAQANPAELKMQELAMQQQSEERSAQLEMEQGQAELQMDVQRLQMELQMKMAELKMKMQEHQLEMAFKQEESQTDLAIQREKGATDIAAGKQQMQLQKQQGEQQLKLGAVTGQQKLAQTKQQSDAKTQAIRQQSKVRSTGKEKAK